MERRAGGEKERERMREHVRERERVRVLQNQDGGMGGVAHLRCSACERSSRIGTPSRLPGRAHASCMRHQPMRCAASSSRRAAASVPARVGKGVAGMEDEEVEGGGGFGCA
jgi:hypothetical protein